MINEDQLEQPCLDWFREVDFDYANGYRTIKCSSFKNIKLTYVDDTDVADIIDQIVLFGDITQKETQVGFETFV